MHFGRLENVRRIDFRFPGDPVRTERFLALQEKGQSKIYIGCPIWASRTWNGVVYPQKSRPTEYLQRYSKIFGAVEVSSTFYHLLGSERIKSWRDEVPREFRFCPKVFRGITEALHAETMPQLLQNFCESIAFFEERLGLVIAQFSEYFGPSHFELLKKFLGLWPQQLPLAVELRHPAWFHQHALVDPLIDLFYRKRVASVITDTPGRRDVLHFSMAYPKVLIRFQGQSGDGSDVIRIREWKKRIEKWASCGLGEIYFFTHQPQEVDIPQTAFLAVKTILGEGAVKRPEKRGQLELFQKESGKNISL